MSKRNLLTVSTNIYIYIRIVRVLFDIQNVTQRAQLFVFVVPQFLSHRTGDDHETHASLV